MTAQILTIYITRNYFSYLCKDLCDLQRVDGINEVLHYHDG
jgi:hypothetical protein